MTLDLVIANARLSDRSGAFDIGVADGLIAAIEPTIDAAAPREDAGGALAFGGFVESHIHLDKACILDRCAIHEGTLAEAVSTTAEAKAGFTEADVYERAARVVELAATHGTTRMRTFVEVDPRAGLRSFEAVRRVKVDYAFAIDIEICAFAQEGLTNEPETAELLDRALSDGADLVGGCPYTDPDPAAHIAAVFDLAERHGVDVDFHADFDLDPAGSALPRIIAETRARRYGGQVSLGHVTKLSAMHPEAVADLATQLAETGVAATVLPATDLFLLGREAERLVPRGLAPAQLLAKHGVVTSVASNNILNPFTPFGDASLGRMVNLYANVAHLSRDDDMRAAFDMVTASAARLMNAPYGLEVGAAADIVLIDAPDPVAAVRQVAPVLAGWKRGRKSFQRPRAELFRPSAGAVASLRLAGAHG